MKLVGVVDWAKEDLDRLMRRFNWLSRPSTEEVRLAQEDLWVYEALLRIIAKTNGPAVKYQRDAPIKQIGALQIGADAVMAWQTAPGGAIIGGPGAAGGPGGRPEYDGYVGSSAGPGPRPPAGSYGEGPGGPGQYPASPTDNRYVDGEGNPLGAAQEHPFAEFKLMPIRMLLLMNQTKLQKLLVECANSSMPVEVRSLAMGVPQGSMPGMGGLSTPIGPPAGHQSYGPGYNGGRAAEYDGYQGSGVGPRGPGGFSGQTLFIQRKNLDVSVDLRGTICIYNPPDEAKLGTGTAAEKTAEPPAAAPVSPPAQTPTPQTPPAETPVAEPAPAGGAPGGTADDGG